MAEQVPATAGEWFAHAEATYRLYETHIADREASGWFLEKHFDAVERLIDKEFTA